MAVLRIGWHHTSGTVPEVLLFPDVEVCPAAALGLDGLYVMLQEGQDPRARFASAGALPLLVDASALLSPIGLPARAHLVTDPLWLNVVVHAWLEGLRRRAEVRRILRHDVWTPVSTISGHLEMLQEGMYGPGNARLNRAAEVMDRSLQQLQLHLDDAGTRIYGPRMKGSGTQEPQDQG